MRLVGMTNFRNSLLAGVAMTAAERRAGRFMRAPDHTPADPAPAAPAPDPAPADPAPDPKPADPAPADPAAPPADPDDVDIYEVSSTSTVLSGSSPELRSDPPVDGLSSTKEKYLKK